MVKIGRLGTEKISRNESTTLIKSRLRWLKLKFTKLGNDAAEVKPGGLGEEVLGEKCSIIQFPDMVHGWTTRGGISRLFAIVYVYKVL